MLVGLGAGPKIGSWTLARSWIRPATILGRSRTSIHRCHVRLDTERTKRILQTLSADLAGQLDNLNLALGSCCFVELLNHVNDQIE